MLNPTHQVKLQPMSKTSNIKEEEKDLSDKSRTLNMSAMEDEQEGDGMNREGKSALTRDTIVREEFTKRSNKRGYMRNKNQVQEREDIVQSHEVKLVR